ncbi:MAG TPA: hypothetical protein VN841_04620 [Bryobacteraceae bacterium]|nr:hypothetical protein [Bryobacteraceae bacterium]
MKALRELSLAFPGHDASQLAFFGCSRPTASAVAAEALPPFLGVVTVNIKIVRQFRC